MSETYNICRARAKVIQSDDPGVPANITPQTQVLDTLTCGGSVSAWIQFLKKRKMPLTTKAYYTIPSMVKKWREEMETHKGETEVPLPELWYIQDLNTRGSNYDKRTRGYSDISLRPMSGTWKRESPMPKRDDEFEKALSEALGIPIPEDIQKELNEGVIGEDG